MNLDLEITNYTIEELETFFKLPPNYTIDNVIQKEDQLTTKIMKSDELSKKKKNDITTFFKEITKLLTEKLRPVIKYEEPPITHVKQEEIVLSNMNPIEKRTMTKSLCIDTLFRENYDKTYSTDYLYKLPNPINNVVSLQLTSFEFPNMINFFSQINLTNTFEITLYNVNTGEYDASGELIYENNTVTLEIPDGNYMSNEFVIMMNNLFSSSDVIGLKFLRVDIDMETHTLIRTYNSSIDQTTIGQFPYDLSDNNYSPDFYFTLNFEVPNKPLYKTAGWMMGFRNKTYTITQSNIYLNLIDAEYPITYEGYIKSESSYGSTIDNYIFLEIDDFHNNYPTNTFTSINTNSYIGKNILARIVLTSGAHTIVMDNAADGIFKRREYFGPIKLEKFRVRILNRFGDVVNLKQNDYSFVLELKQLY
jgi:hypothetical protein